MNKRLHCCDLQSEHSGALTAFEVALEQNVSLLSPFPDLHECFQGWRLGKYCAGLGASTIIQYKCKTTTSSPLKTTTTTSSTTTTIPSCAVDEASKECNQILDDRLRFDVTWTVHEKIHWCKSATKYVRCANRHVSNCSIIDVQDDVEQLTNFIDYLVRQANRHCQGKCPTSLSLCSCMIVALGGFLGCDELAETDVRCHQGPHQFYKGEAFDSAAPHVSLVYVSLLCSIVLALNVLFHLYSEEMCVY